LYIDSAHGAHFGYSNLLPDSIAKNCHACVVSTHKTLPAMTQTACVFAKDLVAGEVKKHLNVFNSSSPNYVLLASIDFARAYMQAKIEGGADRQTYDFVQKIKGIKNLSFLQNDDFCRLVLNNTDGHLVESYLKQNGIIPEFSDASRVVLILSLVESKTNLERLFDVLAKMPTYQKNNNVVCLKNQLLCDLISFGLDGEKTLVDIKDADGFVCAEQCGGYPPCIPLFLKGEKITDASRLDFFDGTFGFYNKKIWVYKK